MLKLKPIAELLDHMPPLSPDLIELAQWISDKYCCALTTSLQVMIPAALKGKADSVVTISEDSEEMPELLLPFEGEWMAYITPKWRKRPFICAAAAIFPGCHID